MQARFYVFISLSHCYNFCHLILLSLTVSQLFIYFSRYKVQNAIRNKKKTNLIHSSVEGVISQRRTFSVSEFKRFNYSVIRQDFVFVR